MAEVTDGDRERAAHIVANWTLHFGPDDHDPLRAMIETFLADEREKARAPFLALAKGLEGWRDNALRYAQASKREATTAAMARARALAYERATGAIRRAAGVTE